MATNHTTNYDLNLWEPTDKFSREEINENFGKLDAAVKAVDTKADAKADAAALTALTQTVNAKADAAAVTAAVNTLNAAIGQKADTSAVTAALAQKPDLAAMNAAVAQCARITVGTYTGDGAAVRVINLGFRPKAVLVWHIDYLQESYSSSSGTTVWGGLVVEGMTNALVDLLDNGFAVKYNNSGITSGNSKKYHVSNASDNKYCYIALC